MRLLLDTHVFIWLLFSPEKVFVNLLPIGINHILTLKKLPFTTKILLIGCLLHRQFQKI